MDFDLIENLSYEQLEELYSDVVFVSEWHWHVTCEDGYSDYTNWLDNCYYDDGSLHNFCYRAKSTWAAESYVCLNRGHGGDYSYTCCHDRPY